eukprot:TRINITY_DN8727_c0_g5_i3.p1 TRINITY_DN8727_c0_g5~~TRINITY_DN8727_c0_g5_i3.p1  ORF type:complete len:186 (-),score=18.10 TRINITY_DN8727_c0_g5_i3:134-691(-)
MFEKPTIHEFTLRQLEILGAYKLGLEEAEVVQPSLAATREKIASTKSEVSTLSDEERKQKIAELRVEVGRLFKSVDQFRYLAITPRSLIPLVSLSQSILLQFHKLLEPEYHTLRQEFERIFSEEVPLHTFEEFIFGTNFYYGGRYAPPPEYLEKRQKELEAEGVLDDALILQKRTGATRVYCTIL